MQEAGVTRENASRMRILIHGGSGSVGKNAIQMLKAWNVAHLVATASTNEYVLLTTVVW